MSEGADADIHKVEGNSGRKESSLIIVSGSEHNVEGDVLPKRGTKGEKSKRTVTI